MDTETADLHLQQLLLSETIHQLRTARALGADTGQQLADARHQLAVSVIHNMARLHAQHWNQHLIDYNEEAANGF